jgi:hypothetical protein
MENAKCGREGARLLKPADGMGGGVVALLGAGVGAGGRSGGVLLWLRLHKLGRWGCVQFALAPFLTANASPDIERWRGRALDVGRGVPAVCGRAEGGKGDTISY